MRFAAAVWIGAACLAAWSGCAGTTTLGRWQEPRPLAAAYPPAELTTTKDHSRVLVNTLTLEDALAVTMEHNPRLLALNDTLRRGDARVEQSSLFPNPSVEMEAEDFGRTESAVRFTQEIPLGGKRGKRGRVAELERDVAAWEVEAARLDVLTETRRVHLVVLTAQRRVELATQQVDLSRRVSESVAELVTYGKSAAVEQTRADVELARAESDRHNADIALRSARNSLAAMWGESIAHFERVEELPEPVPNVPTLTAVKIGIRRHPSYARWEAEAERREAALVAAQSERVPDAELGAGALREGGSGEIAAVVSVGLPIPLFDRNQGAIREAQIDMWNIGRESEAVRIALVDAATTAYDALVSALDESQRLRDFIAPGAQRAFDGVMEGYRAGKFGLMELLDAERAVVETESDLVDAEIRVHRAVIELEYLTATPLDMLTNGDTQ